MLLPIEVYYILIPLIFITYIISIYLQRKKNTKNIEFNEWLDREFKSD